MGEMMFKNVLDAIWRFLMKGADARVERVRRQLEKGQLPYI